MDQDSEDREVNFKKAEIASTVGVSKAFREQFAQTPAQHQLGQAEHR